nr:MAG TPA: hypothetical protein [Caudoviricetes sp.]
MKILANVKANLSNKTIDVRMNRQLLTLTNDNMLEQFDEALDLIVNNKDLNQYLTYDGVHIADEDEVKEIFLDLLQPHFTHYDPDDYIVSATLRLAYFVENGEGYIDENKCQVGDISIQRFYY